MNQTSAPAIPRSLFIFSLLYGGLVVLAGVLGAFLLIFSPPRHFSEPAWP